MQAGAAAEIPVKSQCLPHHQKAARIKIVIIPEISFWSPERNLVRYERLTLAEYRQDPCEHENPTGLSLLILVHSNDRRQPHTTEKIEEIR